MPIDFRLIAATNQNLNEMIASGKFREDLFYRLNVIPIELPPLRERIEDIPYLVRYFLNKFNILYNFQKTIDPKVIDLLCGHSWPGNVRQLQNMVERLVVLSEEQNITERHAYELFGDLFENKVSPITRHHWFAGGQVADSQEDSGYDLQEVLKEIEKYHIETALKKFKTTRKAARHLNLSQPTLVRRVKELNISVEISS